MIFSLIIFSLKLQILTRCSRGSSTNTFVTHSFINSLTDKVILSFRNFKTLYIPNSKSSGAKTLKECSLPTICHMSCVTCHVSGVTCQVSGVTLFSSFHFFLFLFWTKWWILLLESLLSTGPTPSSFYCSLRLPIRPEPQCMVKCSEVLVW